MTALDEINEAISHLANAYIGISGERSISEDTKLQLTASLALVYISQAQEQAFIIKAQLEEEQP